MQQRRRLPLHHAYNVRDLGGYPIDDDHITNWNMVYRADGLHQLDEHDWIYLKKLGIKTIIDLRSSSEIKTASYDCLPYGIRQITLPFMKETIKLDSVTQRNPFENEEFLQSMKLDYVEMLSDASMVLHDVIETIATAMSRQEGVLFHCSAGKDRTGIVSVLLLQLCGVSDYDILADYQVSCTYNSLGINRMMPENLKNHPNVKGMLASSPEMMEPLLALLHEVGCVNYLVEQGVDEQHLHTIAQHFVGSV